ncbi:MAG: hypothetical protein ACXACU_17375, partial [Candidatus Hodarchaeales archaeon]
MSETSDPITEDTTRRKRDVIKLRILAIGIIIVVIAFLLFQFFMQLRYPPELKLPENLRPNWTQDQNLVDTMAFVGDMGIIFTWIVFLIGSSCIIYGFVNRVLDKRISRQRFEETLVESFFIAISKDKNFALVAL